MTSTRRSVLKAAALGAAAGLAAPSWLAAAAREADPDAIDMPDGIDATRTACEAGQGVHLRWSRAALGRIAAAHGLSSYEAARQAEYHWSFSAAPAEDYPFAALPADMRGPRSAGSAAGPFAAHVYERAGRHEVEALLHLRGRLYRARAGISVTPRAYAWRRVGVCVPDSDVTGAPRFLHGYTDIDAALAALGTGEIDCLLLRRGARYALRGRPGRRGGRRASYMVGSGQCIDAFGSAQAPPPVIEPVFGAGGLETFRPAFEAVGDGRARAIPVESGQDGDLQVYVDDRLQRPDRDYGPVTQGGRHYLLLRAAPVRGARLRVFAARRGGRLPARGGSILRVTGRGARIRNLSIRGPYDPAAPSRFDPHDLASFDHAILFDGVKADGDSRDVALVNLSVSGLRSGVIFPSICRNMFMAGCRLTDWYNYGAYWGKALRACMIGCDIRQSLGALNGPGAKAENLPGTPNYSDHGPLRSASSFEEVINRCRMDSRTGWGARRVGAVTAQPVTRLATSNEPGRSYCLSECHTTGGGGVYGAGVPNPWIPIPRHGLIYVCNNVFVLGDTGRYFAGSMVPLTSIGNLYLALDTDTVRDFRVNKSGDLRTLAAADALAGASRFVNDTFVILMDRPSRELLFGAARVLSPSGIQNRVGRFEVMRPGPVQEVPVEVPTIPGKQRFAWRIWRQPVGLDERDATAFATLSAQESAYELATDGGAAPRRARTLRVRLRSGAFAAGEVIHVSREMTLESTHTRIDGSGDAVAARDDRPETFYPNNRPEPLVVPAPEIHNAAIMVEGDWARFRLEDGGPALDPRDYRAARFAPLDAFYRPRPGSPALATARGAHVARRDLAGGLRPARPALGALEAETDLSGWAALPRMPRGVTLDWRDLPLAPGRVDATRVALALADQGEPALRPGDAAIRFERVTDGAAQGAARLSVAPGDELRAVATWTHPAIGRRSVATPHVIVPVEGFVPMRLANDGHALIRGERAAPLDGPHHVALRWTARGTAAGVLLDGGGDGVGLHLAGATLTLSAGRRRIDLPGAVPAGATVSLLLSVFPGRAGAVRLWLHAGGAQAPAPRELADGAGAFAGGGRFTLFGGRDGAVALEIDEYAGIWTGGAPGFLDAFAPDGTVRQWGGDPSLGVAGLRPALLLRGAAGFNRPDARNMGVWPGGVRLSREGGDFRAL